MKINKGQHLILAEKGKTIILQTTKNVPSALKNQVTLLLNRIDSLKAIIAL